MKPQEGFIPQLSKHSETYLSVAGVTPAEGRRAIGYTKSMNRESGGPRGCS